MAEENEIDVLKQIRDLLVPIAAHYRPGYEESLRREREEKARRFPQVVRGRQARAACIMMDSAAEQAEIRRKVGIASGNLSALIDRLDQEGMLERGSDRRRPQLIFTKQELERLIGGTQ